MTIETRTVIEKVSADATAANVETRAAVEKVNADSKASATNLEAMMRTLLGRIPAGPGEAMPTEAAAAAEPMAED